MNDGHINLNPKNVLLAHHRCHNAIHERFGQAMMQRVYIVYGASLAGKTSYRRASKGHKDLVLDLDELYQVITLLPVYDIPTEMENYVFNFWMFTSNKSKYAQVNGRKPRSSVIIHYSLNDNDLPKHWMLSRSMSRLLKVNFV